MCITLLKVRSPYSTLGNTSEPIMLNKKQQQKMLILVECEEMQQHYWKLHCTFF